MITGMSLLLILSFELDRCASALLAAPQYVECAAQGPGVALSMKKGEAEALARYGETARQQFIRYFPSSPGPYAVLYYEKTPPLEGLKSAGFPTVLAWPSPETVGDLILTNMRQRASAAGAALSERVEGIIQARAAPLIASLIANQEDVVAHELGHLWYQEIYWRNSGLPSDGYGTPAPDWLDETAAILMEGSNAGDVRRNAFRRAWNATEPLARSENQEVGDIAYFLRRSHPKQSERDGTQEETKTVAVGVNETDKNGFYNQARIFADYLLAKTSDARVFEKITLFLAHGGKVETWFAEQRDYPSLPRSVQSLQHDWTRWVNREPA